MQPRHRVGQAGGQHFRRTGPADDLRSERILRDERLTDPPTFLDVNRGELVGVGHVVEVALLALAVVGAFGDKLEPRFLRSAVGRHADRRAGDATRRHFDNCGFAGAGVVRVAVANQDAVLQSQVVLGVRKGVVSGDQERVEVGHVPRHEGIDFRHQVVSRRAVLLADHLKRDVPRHPGPAAAEAAVLDHADHVRRPEPLNGELGNVLLPLVAVRHFGGVHDKHQPTLTGGFEGLNFTIDRQRRFDRRALIAARAEAVRPADHHQPAPLVVHGRSQHFGLVVGEAFVGDVGQNHRVVVAQEDAEFALVLREFIGGEAIDAELVGRPAVLLRRFKPQRGQQVIVRRAAAVRRVFVQQQHPPLAPRDDCRFDTVVRGAVTGQAGHDGAAVDRTRFRRRERGPKRERRIARPIDAVAEPEHVQPRKQPHLRRLTGFEKLRAVFHLDGRRLTR